MVTYEKINVKVLNELLPESEILDHERAFSLIPCSNRRTALHYSRKYRFTSSSLFICAGYLAAFHVDFLETNKISYTLSDKAPESFKELRKLNPHKLIISNFSEAGEKSAIKHQYGKLCKYLSQFDLDHIPHLMICKLFLVDTALQVKYYYDKKEFVENQREFAMYHMNNTPMSEIIQYLES
jgi:hypothetical protein